MGTHLLAMPRIAGRSRMHRLETHPPVETANRWREICVGDGTFKDKMS